MTTLQVNPDNKGYIDAASLKWIAIISMLIDHIGVVLLDPSKFTAVDFDIELIYTICRLIGRLAFPIFAFLIVEGIVHTRNAWSYIVRLTVFAFISEIPFDLATSGLAFNFANQNIFFTLALAAFSLHLHRLQRSEVLRWGVLIFAPLMAWLISSDYNWYGVAVIYSFYLFREWKLIRNLITGSLLIAQWTAVGALIPISFYNGKRGHQNKYFFYIFYPAHLLLLWAIKRMI